MSELFKLTTTIESSLKTILRAAEEALETDTMPGLSQFDLATLPQKYEKPSYAPVEETLAVREVVESEQEQAVEEPAVEDVVIEEVVLPTLELDDNTTQVEEELAEVSESVDNVTIVDVIESSNKSRRSSVPAWDTIVFGASSTKDDSLISATVSVPQDENINLNEDSLSEESAPSDDINSTIDEVPVDTPEAEVKLEEVNDTPAEVSATTPASGKSEDELWLESTGFGLNDIDVVAEGEVDYFDLIEEPTDETQPASKTQKISDDQVVLVVEQLVVNPNQATTITQGGVSQVIPGAAPAPTYTYPSAPQPTFYAPPVVMPQDGVSIAPAAPQRPGVPVQPIIQQQATPVYMPPPIAPVMPQEGSPTPQMVQGVAPVYQAPAAPPAEVTVNVTPGLATPSYSPPVAPQEGVQHIDQTIIPPRGDADQIIEIRSDATSISANTVSVESSQPLLPSLANFDPRKYFTNEVIAPKLDDVQPPKPEFPTAADTMTYQPAGPVRPSVPAPPIEDFRAEPVALGNSDVVVEQGPQDIQKVTQMFKELRRMRDR